MKLVDYDAGLEPFLDELEARREYIATLKKHILGDKTPLEFARGWHHFGLHKTKSGWVLREWAPAATALYLVTKSNGWQDDPSFAFTPIKDGEWQLELPPEALRHGEVYKLHVYWDAGRQSGFRIPAYR